MNDMTTFIARMIMRQTKAQQQDRRNTVHISFGRASTKTGKTMLTLF